MKKVFISQPMSGLPEVEVMVERLRAKLDVEDRLGEKVEIIENFYKENIPENVKPIWFLGNSIALMYLADIVYFVKGYEKARGCVLEHLCAEAYNIPIIHE